MGGFPEVSLLETEFEKNKLIKEYLGAMFFRDLVEKYRITNMPLLEALTDKLFSSFAMKVSLSAFYKQYKDKLPFSKDLLFRYYRHFIESMLVFEVRKLAESTYKRHRNPAKVYLVDTGLSRRATSADVGRLLENMVFLELLRKGHEVFYFEGKGECDFIARADGRESVPVQVIYELNEENSLRETKGLVEACRYLQVKKGLMLTEDTERTINAEGVNITVLPAWKWILS